MSPRKILTLIKFRLLNSFNFRFEILVWLLLDFFPFFIILFVFQNLYGQQEMIRGLTISQVFQYYFFASVVQGLTAVHFEGWRAAEIRNGKIDFYLIRPFSYLSEMFFADVAGKFFYFLLFLPLYVLFIWLIESQFGIFVLAGIDITNLVPFIFLLISAYIIQSFIGTIITLLTFWFEGAEGLEHFKWFALTILSGTILPLEFMPVWLRNLVEALPFKYLYLVPISVLQDRRELVIYDLVILGGTMIFLFVVCRLLLERGRRRYGSFGG